MARCRLAFRHAAAIILLTALALASALAFASPRVADPRYAVPVAVFPGGVFNATLIGADSSSGAWIVAPGINYTLEVVATYPQDGGVTITLKVPVDVEGGLYDLYVNASGAIVSEPRAVWVLEEEPEKLTIMHLSDIHVEIVIKGTRSTVYVETAFNLLNTLPADLAIVTGDCVDVGSDVSSLKKLRELVNRARKPTFLVPGNHDRIQTDEKSFAEVYYGKYVGPPFWYRVVGPFLIVGLDTGLEGYVSHSQLKWFESVVAAHPDKVKIVVMHHPIFRYGTFASLEGTWKELDKLKNYFYASWADHPAELKEFMRIVEEYEIDLVLSGHVHGDGVVLYNGKTWFVTTVTAGGSADFRGFRLVTIDRDGNVEIRGAAGYDPLKEPASFVLDGTVVRVFYDRRHTAATALVKINPRIGMNIENVTLFLLLNASKPLSEYKVFNQSPVGQLTALRYGDYHLAVLIIPVQPAKEQLVTVAAYKDEEPPSVSVTFYTPRRPVASKDRVTLYVKASDEGWGVRKVAVRYALGQTERELEAREVGAGTYQVEIPPLNTTTLRVEAIAVDFAGNTATAAVEITYVQPQKPKEEEKPAAEEKPEEEKPAEEEKPEEEAQPPPPAPQLLPAELIAGVAVAAALAVAAVIILTQRRS